MSNKQHGRKPDGFVAMTAAERYKRFYAGKKAAGWSKRWVSPAEWNLILQLREQAEQISPASVLQD